MSLSTPYLARIELWSLWNATDMPYDMGTAGIRIVVHSLKDEPTSKPFHAALVVCILSYKEQPEYFLFPLDLLELPMMNLPVSLLLHLIIKKGIIAMERKELKIMELG